MKKFLLSFLLSVCFANVGLAANEWRGGTTEATIPGTGNASDIDAYSYQNMTDPLDRLLSNYRRDCTVTKTSAAALSVGPGEIVLSNSAGTVRKFRKNTTATAVAWTDIDAGAEETSTQYYVHAVGDADATTFTVKISKSATAPTGVTYFKKIGYFYNNADGDIVSVGNYAGGDVKNLVTVLGTSDITTTSDSYADVDDMVVYFISSGRPVHILATGPYSGYGLSSVAIDVDGTDETTTALSHASGSYMNDIALEHIEAYTAGAHTIKVQWHDGGAPYAVYQYGTTWGPRKLTVWEE